MRPAKPRRSSSKRSNTKNKFRRLRSRWPITSEILWPRTPAISLLPSSCNSSRYNCLPFHLEAGHLAEWLAMCSRGTLTSSECCLVALVLTWRCFALARRIARHSNRSCDQGVRVVALRVLHADRLEASQGGRLIFSCRRATPISTVRDGKRYRVSVAIWPGRLALKTAQHAPRPTFASPGRLRLVPRLITGSGCYVIRGDLD